MQLNGVLLAAGLAILAAPALAETLDLDAVYGNAEGCENLRSGAISDFQLVLRSDAIEGYVTGCEIVKVMTARDGVRIVKGMCASEGEAGFGVGLYTIARSPDDPKALKIYQYDGSLWDEVKPCS